MNQISYLILGMTFYTIEGVIITIFLIAVAIIVILFVISRHKDFLALEAEMKQPNIENMRKALELLAILNPQRNDFDSYAYQVAEWGLGTAQKPNPEHYGLPEGKK